MAFSAKILLLTSRQKKSSWWQELGVDPLLPAPKNCYCLGVHSNEITVIIRSITVRQYSFYCDSIPVFWWARGVIYVVGRDFPTFLFVASWRAQRFCHSERANPSLALTVPAPLARSHKLLYMLL